MKSSVGGWLGRALFRLTGKAEWPSSRYIGEKLRKYLTRTPVVYARAGIRAATGYQPILRIGQRFLFLGGLHRSGTSPLYKVLRRHPSVSGIADTVVPQDEGQHLQSVYLSDRAYGVLFAFEQKAHLTECDVIEPNRQSTDLLRQWGRFLDFRQPWLVEKSPSNLLRCRFLNTIFPDSLFVIVIRHPIAYALALRKWTDQPTWRIIDHWHEAHAIMLADTSLLLNKVLIRYEDLVKYPTDTLTTLWTAMGVNPLVSENDFYDANEEYFVAWSLLSDEERSTCQKRLCALKWMMNLFGYGGEMPFIRKRNWERWPSAIDWSRIARDCRAGCGS